MKPMGQAGWSIADLFDYFGWHWNHPAGTTYASQLGNITSDANHTHYFTIGTWRLAETA